MAAVRKVLFLFLLICLPFQFVWAAAAPYCEHEQGNTVSHVGHHQHLHAAETATSDDGDLQTPAKASTTADADCGYCHLSCQPSFVTTPLPGLAAPEGRADLFLLSSFSSRIPDRLLRPDWRLAA